MQIHTFPAVWDSTATAATVRNDRRELGKRAHTNLCCEESRENLEEKRTERKSFCTEISSSRTSSRIHLRVLNKSHEGQLGRTRDYDLCQQCKKFGNKQQWIMNSYKRCSRIRDWIQSTQNIFTLIPHFRACRCRPCCSIVPLLFLRDTLLGVRHTLFIWSQYRPFHLVNTIFFLQDYKSRQRGPLRTRSARSHQHGKWKSKEGFAWRQLTSWLQNRTNRSPSQKPSREEKN